MLEITDCKIVGQTGLNPVMPSGIRLERDTMCTSKNITF
jgi:hypothetical protein